MDILEDLKALRLLIGLRKYAVHILLICLDLYSIMLHWISMITVRRSVRWISGEPSA